MRVAINMAMSIDGKIATAARGPVKLGSEYDSRRMSEIRSEHDAVINGASTFAAHPFPLTVTGKDLLEERAHRGQPPQPISAITSSALKIPRDTPWEKAAEVRRWAFCGSRAPSEAVKSLEKAGVRVIQSAAERPGADEIYKAFEEEGVKRLLLEGGGEFNASFLEKGLVDEIHLTLVPIVVGGAQSPSWCEGHGFSEPFPRFSLVECQDIEGELYLTYRRQ